MMPSSARKMLGTWIVFIWAVTVTCLSAQTAFAQKQMHIEQMDPTKWVRVCVVYGYEPDVEKWLGRDYGTLVVAGTGTRGEFEMLSMPSEKAKALRRIKSIAKKHHLRLLHYTDKGLIRCEQPTTRTEKE